MTSFKCLQQTLVKWEALRTQRLEQYYTAPKRAVPDWLQASLESQGLVFDHGGQVLSSPDRSAGTHPRRIDEVEGRKDRLCSQIKEMPSLTLTTGRCWKYKPLPSAQNFHTLGTR